MISKENKVYVQKWFKNKKIETGDEIIFHMPLSYPKDYRVKIYCDDKGAYIKKSENCYKAARDISFVKNLANVCF